jgi:hypothetical protein
MAAPVAEGAPAAPGAAPARGSRAWIVFLALTGALTGC